MIDKVRGGLRHVPAIAGRANPAPLARERDDKPLAAARAEGTAEPKAEDAALEIPAEFLLDVARHGTLRHVTPLEPAREVLGDDLVERSLLGAATLVAAAWCRAGMRPEAGPRGKSAECSDHGQSGEWTGVVIARTLLAGCRPPPAGPSERSDPDRCRFRCSRPRNRNRSVLMRWRVIRWFSLTHPRAGAALCYS